jgi:hypothetical protein
LGTNTVSESNRTGWGNKESGGGKFQAVAAELDDAPRRRSMYVAQGVENTLPPSQPEIDRSTVRMELRKVRFSVLGTIRQEGVVRASGYWKTGQRRRP